MPEEAGHLPSRCYLSHGGKLVVPSGAEITIESGGDLKVSGSSLIDEVAALSGLDAGELGVLNGVTPGTAAASKAVVLDANLDIATLRHVTINGNLVTGSTTLSETDLAKIDGITNGTVVVGKAVVPTTNKVVDDLDITALKLNGVVVAATDVFALSDQSTVVVAAPSGTTQTITITLKNSAGTTIAAVQSVDAYFCTDAAGATPSGTGAGTSVTATTGAVISAHTAKLHLALVSDANGVIVLSVDNASGGGTYTNRLALILPNGRLKISDALATPNA